PEGKTAPSLFLIGDPAERNGEGNEAVDRIPWVAAESGRMTARRDHLDIGTLKAGPGNTAVEDGFQFLPLEGELHAQLFDRAQEAFDVSIQTEELAFPDVDHVVGGIGAKETPVQDGDASLCNGKVATFKPGHPRRIALLLSMGLPGGEGRGFFRHPGLLKS